MRSVYVLCILATAVCLLSVSVPAQTVPCQQVVNQGGWTSTSDIGLVIGTIWQTGGQGSCASLYGLTPGIYYAASDPFTVAINGNTSLSDNQYELQWPTGVQIITSVPWTTTGGGNVIAVTTGPAQGPSVASGAVLAACTSGVGGGCGPNPTAFPPLTPWNQTLSTQPLVYVTGGPVSVISTTVTSLSVSTVPNGASSCVGWYNGSSSTNTGPNNCGNQQVAQLPSSAQSVGAGGYIVVSTVAYPTISYCQSHSGCYSLYIQSCTPVGGSGSNCTNNLTATSYVLTFNETLAQAGLPANGNYYYVLYQPNATVLLMAGFTGKSPTLDSFGTQIGPLRLDGEGIVGFVGWYDQQLQEGTRNQTSGNYDMKLIATTGRVNQGAGEACWAHDRGFQTNTTGGIGTAHAYWDLGQCDMSNGSSNTPYGQDTSTAFGMAEWESDCFIYEGYPLTKSNVGDGPNGVVTIGSCVGTSSNWFTAGVRYEADRAEFSPIHEEFTGKGFWLGPTNVTAGVVIDDGSQANSTSMTICSNVDATNKACALVYLDTYAAWGNIVRGGDAGGYSNVDLVYDVKNACGDLTSGSPCIYNSTASGSNTHATGRVLPGTYYQPVVSGSAATSLLGTPTAPTPPTATNNTQVATTAYVQNQGYIMTSVAQAAFSGIGNCAANGVVSGLNANALPNCAPVFSEVYATASATTNGNLGPINMVSPSTTTLYRISFYALQVAAGVGCTSNTDVVANVIFEDPLASAATTFAVTNFYISGSGTANAPMFSLSAATYSSYVFRAKSSTNVQYSTTVVSGSCTISPTYLVIPLLEQLL
jgi:hypothetical protein